MGSTWALFRAGLRHQTSYRFAMVSGLVTNTFFGLVRTAVFLAVYRTRDEVAGLDLADAITYVWLLQAVFAVTWSPWLRELPTSIRSGEWTAELLRPGSVLGRHLAYDSGRTASLLIFRAPIPLAFAAVAFDLRLPTTPPGIAALALSLVLAAFAAVCLRFLLGSVAFWTADFRGIHSLVFGPVYLLSGFVIPAEFFPGALRMLSTIGPLAPLLRSPVAVAGGREILAAIAVQVVWIGLYLLACRSVLTRATQRMVVFGG
ncbi:ABC transporter permease [Actinospongicola halichondriae]|uniref:ABC transporter permease n=1 Tax=Actinospongicola halichondriae TaxID=3236844 RepID=UPI003D499C8F